MLLLLMQTECREHWKLENQQIHFALALDLESSASSFAFRQQLISQFMTGKQAKQEDRNRALQYALLWGYADPHLSSAERRRIAKAACQLVAYDHGYAAPLSHNMLPAWEAKLRNVLDTGEESETATSPKHAGSVSYVAKIEERYPGYIRELWRYAIRTLGAGATYNELAECINAKSAVPGEDRARAVPESSTASELVSFTGRKGALCKGEATA